MKEKGFSLIEVLVAIVMFTLLAIVATQTTVSSLQGSRVSDAGTQVRENMEYALSVLERHVRNASSIVSACNGSSVQTLTYLNEKGRQASFQCLTDASGTYLASNSATVRLTSSSITLTTCSFVCSYPSGASKPPQVTVNLAGKSKSTDSLSQSIVTISSSILLRSY
jgi:prepilin-type N-terminal cleavage/methylation domain-containing protein